jgi:uncharacterized ion transporter superfamily protein YfcC
MDAHPTLTMFVYVALIVAALLVIAYWVMYTRRLKTSPRLGKSEGIALATEERERRGNPRHAA